MGIRRNGNTPAPDPVTFPNAHTTLVFGVVAVGGKATTADVTYTIATPGVTFDNASTQARLEKQPVAQNGTKISLPVRFRIASGATEPNVIEVGADIRETKGTDTFHATWTVGVLQHALMMAAASTAAAAATAAVAMMVPHIMDVVERSLAGARGAAKKPKARAARAKSTSPKGKKRKGT
jgi:hypothetical protein